MTDQATFAQRRADFTKRLDGGIAVIPAAAETIRNEDVEHHFRQSSDFFYLTGFDEPDAVAVLRPAGDEPFVLFVRPQDRELEIWNGYRAGVDGAKERFGADAAYPIGDLDAKLKEYLVGQPRLYYRSGGDHDGRINRLVGQVRAMHSRSGRGAPFEVHDPSLILHEQRLIKGEVDLAGLRKAAEISAEAHLEAMRFAQPGRWEYQVQAALEYVFRMRGSSRDGYPSIVAGGANAVVLHYTENNAQLGEGDLLLIDAGAEYAYYSADITRTFPVSGTFSDPQRAIYEIVLAAQQAAFAECRPGSTLKAGHDAARRVLSEGLIDLGLVPRGLEDTMAMHHYREYFMHGTGHWLGMDVHDVGAVRIEGEPRPLEPGMAFTVEPGLYVDPQRETVDFYLHEYDADEWAYRRLMLGSEAARKLEKEEREKAMKLTHPVPEKLRGIGVRIEDDVVITADGHEDLSSGAPTAIDEVEAATRQKSLLPLL